MTSRERLLTALRDGTPDRVPVTLYEYCPYNDDWPTREPSYAPLLELERTLGDSFVYMPTPLPTFFDATQLRRTETRKSSGSIIRTTHAETPRGPLRWIHRRDPQLMTWWQIEPAIKSDADIERVLALPDPPIVVDPARIHTIADRVGDAGILCFNPGDALGRIVDLFAFTDFVQRAVRDDGPIRALLHRAQAQLIAAVRAIGDHVTDAAFRLWGPEYCGAPLMDPRRFFEPYVVAPDHALTDVIHATGNLSIIHCHGRLKHLLPMLPDIAADALEPLELLPLPSADVTLAELKQHLGDKLCLMGAVQARTLECGTVADIENEVRAAIDVGAPGGGFILLPTAAPFMLPLAPRTLQNAGIMYQTAHQHGQPG